MLRPAYRAYLWANQRNSVVANVDGITYDFDLREYIDSAMYYDGCFEPVTTAAINKLCRQGMTVIDIGANIGCHTLRFAKLAGPSGKVIAFEPMSWANAKLMRNLELNTFENVVVEKVALSDRKDSRTGYFRSSWVTGTTSNPVSVEKQLISFTTLDSYLTDHKVERVDFIKLDVDGHEFKTLRGAAGTLAAHHPLIIMELQPDLLERNGDDPAAMINFLSELDYLFYEEATLQPFDDIQATVRAIPSGASINVILSARGLQP